MKMESQSEESDSMSDSMSGDDQPAAPNKLSKNTKVAIAVIVTVWVGISCHVCQPHADIVTSSYVILQIVTTIGYGDITPQTPGFKLFMAGYMMVLLVLVAYVLNALTDRVISRSMDQLNSRIQAGESGAEVPTKSYPLLGSSLMFALAVIVGTVFYRYQEHCSCSYGDTWAGNESCPSEPADVAFEACGASGGQVKTWIDAFYFSVTSVTTVGFGDYTPKSFSGRIFGMAWMILGVASTGFFIATMSKSLFNEADPLDRLNEHDALKMDRTLFRSIDVDGNGFLSRGEYYEFALKKYGLVTEDTLAVLRTKFDSMGGEADQVTFEQLREARRRRIKPRLEIH